jgi:hypothetical protein
MNMNLKFMSIIVLASLMGCNHDDESTSLDVYISNGQLQCRDNAIPVATTEAYLTDAGIAVTNSSCGIINGAYSAVCDSDAGKIHVYTIAKTELYNAENLGFTETTKIDAGYTPVECDTL